MTKQESDRLTRVETNQDNHKELLLKIEEKLDRNYDVILAKVEKLERQFVTRSELRITQWFIGIAISITLLVFTVVDKVRSH
jgi:hypothetical protein